MKRFYLALLFAAALLALLAGLVLFRPVIQAARPQVSPVQAVQKAWRLAQQDGSYEFKSEVTQVTYPAPAIANVGQSSTQETYYLQGEVNSPADTLSFTLYQNAGNIATRKDGVEIRIEGDQAYGRAAGGTWQALDGFSGVFAPASDPLAYLAGAKDFALAPNQAPYTTHYTFQLDGPAFAVYLRNMLEEQLRRSGELPPGLSLDSSRTYQQMSGQGEIWLDGNGLPVRLVVSLDLPDAKTGQRISAQIQSDFSGLSEGKSLAAASSQPIFPPDWGLVLPQVVFWGLFAFVLAGLLVFWRSKKVYAAFAITVIASMVASPLLQSVKVSAFYDSQEQKQQQAQAAQEKQAAIQQARADLQASNWDPNQDPLAGSAPAPVNSTGQDVPNEPVLADSPAAAASVNPNALDSDQDGLSDETERQLGTKVNDADSDGDNLGDGVELLRLGTDPLSEDTDGDGIYDNVEVEGFVDGNGQHWYLNPNNADTNKDRRTDTLECSALVGVAQVGDLQCEDTDGDGTPDVFDRDDDGDGVADTVDLFPDGMLDRNGSHQDGSSPTPFNDENPFKLNIGSLQADRPVFVDFQLRTLNPEHLTYAMNVLDWPSQDIEGQIQHVKPTTFGSQMDAQQLLANPSMANGDMELIPMLEITIPGSSVPLATTTPQIAVEFRQNISATITLKQNTSNRDNTNFSFAFENGGSHTVKLYQGSCPATGALLKTFDNVLDSQTRTFVSGSEHKLTLLADGEHALTVSDGTHSACTTIGNLLNGPYDYQMIDTAPFQPYGISLRELDANGTLAAYLPLNMVPDETGGGRSAFSARMRYQVSGTNLWQRAQQVRVVWLLDALTDNCNADGFEEDWATRVAADSSLAGDEGAKEAAFRTWCSLPEHRSADQTQVVHTYPEDWYLTGLTVYEDHGLDVAVAYEDSSSGDVNTSTNLWQLAMGLGSTFIGAHDCVDTIASNNPDYDPDSGRCHANEFRDLGVFSYDPDGNKLADSNIYSRFDQNGSVADGDAQRWGIAKDALHVQRFRYDTQDHLAYMTMTRVPEILQANFARDAQPTLLFASEEHYRSANLYDTTRNGSVFSINMGSSSRPLETIAGLKWMPYQYQSGSGWTAISIEDYWDPLEVLYTDLFKATNPEDSDKANLGRAIFARSYYVSLMQGLTGQVQDGNKILSQYDPAGEDSDSFMSQMKDTGISAVPLAKVVVKWIARIVKDTYDFYGLRKMLAVASGSMGTQGSQIKTQILLESTADSIAINTYGPWKTFFSGGINAKLGGCLAITGAIAIVGLTVYGATQQSNPLEIVQVVLLGLGALGAVQAVAGQAQSLLQAVKAAGSLTAAIKNGFASATVKAQAAANKGAIVGLVIGVAVAWGSIAVQAGLSYGMGGGMSRIEWGTAVATAIASTIVAIIMFAIACIPVFGQLIAAIIGLIDSVINLICTVVLGDDQADNAAANWFCSGITGLVSKVFTVLIYSGNVMVDLYPTDGSRLEFFDFNAEGLVDPNLGISVGNAIHYSLSLTNTITIAPLPDDLGAAYRYQYNDKQLRSSSFLYDLSITNTLKLDENLERYTTTDWAYVDGNGPEWGDFGHTWHKAEPVYITRSAQNEEGIPFESAGINQSIPLYLLEGWAIPSQNCILGVCTIWTERGTENYDLGSGIKFDVFPATLDEFYSLSSKDGGYALGWAQTGEVTFPRLVDADGDGIPYPTDTHDNTWDNDGDGLSDGYEVRLGTDPDNSDSDGDGLSDSLELIAETNPLRADSDGDGLSDGQEVFHQDTFDQDRDGNTSEWLGGWQYAYNMAADGSPQTTWVIPSPLNADSDGDSLNDYLEKSFGFNPNWVSSPNVLTFASSLSEADGQGGYSASDGFVQPGDNLYYSASVENELYNRWAQGLLSTDFPAAINAGALTPQSFLLYPMQQQVLSGEVSVSDLAPSGVYSLTQTAGALISDWAELAADADLWYPFEDAATATTFADRSGSIPAQDGTCSNATAGAGCVPVKDEGIYGGGLRFDGNARIDSDYDPSDSAFAISLWFKTAGANGGLFEVDKIWDRWLYLEGGKVKAKMFNGMSSETLASAQTYNDSKWHQAVYTFGGPAGGQKLYVDGQQVASGHFQVARANHNAIRLGYTGLTNIGYFSGTIDDVRLYDRGLTFNEVQTLFDSPVLDLRFNQNSGWKDSSPFGNNATCSVNCPSRVDGIDGRAANFNGSQYLSVPGDNSLKLDRGGFTIGVWIYPGASPETCREREFYSRTCADWQPQPQGILGFGSGEGSAYPTIQRVGNQLRFTYGDKPYLTTRDVLKPNKWNHVAVTYDGSNLLIYVNGEKVAEDATTFNTPPPDTKTLTIGRSGTAATLEVKKIRVDQEGDGSGKAEFCLAFKSGGDWQTVFNQQVSGGLVDSSGFPLLYDVSAGPFKVSSSATLRAWEDDGGERCVTDKNKGDADPKDDGDDSMGLWTFSNEQVSEGFDRLYATDPTLDPYRYYAQKDYAGDSSGYFYYVYHNDSIPFYGKIDELQIYNRPFDSASIQEMVQAQRLSLHLKFDDAPGETSFADASFGQHNASCSEESCPLAGVAGRVNQGTLFDGNDALTLVNSGINRLTNEFSVAAWVKPQRVSGYQRILATARTKSNNGFAFGLAEDGLRFTTYGIKDYNLYDSGIEAGKWTHVAAVMGADNAVSFYVNGSLQGKVSGSAPANPDTDDVLLIGATTELGTANRTQFFTGRLDDVYVFSNALGLAGIQNLYQQAPIFQLHLDDPQGATTFVDDSNYRSNATCSCDRCPKTGFWIDGQIGTAAEFDGQNDALSAAYNLNQVFDKMNTLSAWVFPTALKEDLQPLVVNISKTAGNPQYGLYLKPNSMTPEFRLWNCSIQVELDADVPLVMNTWNHVVATYDGIANRMSIYVNGSLQGSRTKPGNLCYAYGPLQIGGGVTDTSPFAGRLDEVTLYDNPLSAQEIAEIFNYQGKWVEERQSHHISVDDDNPSVSLKTSGDRLPNSDVQMLISASDPSSGIQKVEFGVKRPDDSSYTWSAAPLCQDAAGQSAWCPTFFPSGEGTYNLRARATDLVGHLTDADSTVYVDNQPPDASFDFSANALLLPRLSTTQANTWELALSGRVSDPNIGTLAGSGVNAGSLQVSLYDSNGSLVGTAPQRPRLSGSRWSLNYQIHTPHPSGLYTVTLQVADQISLRAGLDADQLDHHRREISQTIQIDASPPAPNLDLGPVPATITSTQTLSGQVSERPVALQVSWETDASADQLGLAVRCSGQTYHLIQPGTLPPLADSYSWRADVPRGASCQVELSDSAGDGGSSGSVEVCGAQVASWAADYGSSRTVNFNAAGEACGPSPQVAGVAGVETAWISTLPGSPFDPQGPLPGQALYLTFDDLPGTTGALSFRDLSGSGRSGTCQGETCPATGQSGHLGNAVFFDGLDDQVRVSQANPAAPRDQFSLSFWLQPQGRSGGVLLFKQDEFAVSRNISDGEISWMLGNSDPGWGSWQDSGIVAAPNRWTHLALVYDQGFLYSYANGVLVNTRSASGSIPDQSPLLIGKLGQGAYRGLLDDLQLYDRALSAAEIHGLFLGSGPVLELPLDQSWASDGTPLPDQSAWAQDGSLSTGASDPVNKAVTGQVGTFALHLDGQNDHIRVPDSPALDLEQFSLGLWVNPDTWSYSQASPLLLKGKRAGDNLNYGLYITQQGMLELRFYDASCTTLHSLTTGGPPFNQWSQILATFDGSQAALYLNGKLLKTEAVSTGLCQNDDPLLIGETLNGSTYYRGAIDEVLLYPRALSELEARQLYAAGWQAAGLSASGAGVAQADWEAVVPAGLEGTFRLVLRAADTNGVYSRPQAAWQGDLDTLDPRLSLTTRILGDTIQYTSVAQDWNLSAQGYNSPCGSGVLGQVEQAQALWYQALIQDGKRPYRFSTQCERSIGELPGEIGAYDTPGLAYGVALSGTLAYIADGDAGLQIVDVSNPLVPQSAGGVPGILTSALDVAPGGPVLQPDLVVDSLVTDPASPLVDQPFTITVTVRNQGNGTAWNFLTALFQDGAPTPCQSSSTPWTATIPSLAAGESLAVRFSHPGLGDLAPHDFYATVDSTCLVSESDEGNNQLGPQVLNAVQPDLAIGALSFDPAVPLEGQLFTATMTISNTGGAPSGIFTTTLYVDQPLSSDSCGQAGYASQASASLDPGASQALSFVYPGFAGPGTHDFVAYVDSTCSIAEMQELNNYSSAQVAVSSTPKADLIVDNWQVDHNPVLTDEPLVFTATVRNQGTAASGVFTTTAFLNSEPTVCLDLAGAFDAARIDNLEPGQAAQVNFTSPGIPATGQVFVTAQADSQCEVDELNEANNTSYPLYIDVLAAGQPDLLVEQLDIQPFAPTISQSLVLSMTLKNQGLGPAENFDSAFYVDNVPAACDEGYPDWYFAHTDVLAAGASTVISMTYSGFEVAGEHQVYAQADAACSVSESNETNNISQPLTLTVTSGSSMSDLGMEPATAGDLASPAAANVHPILAPDAQGLTYAYLATSKGLAIVDVSDPASPALIGSLDVAGATRAVQVDGDITYLLAQFDGLFAIDTSNPGYPGLLDHYDTPGKAEGLAIQGDYAYIADGLSGLQIIDISSPNHLTLSATYDTPGYAYGVAVVYPYAYVADGSGGLQILDISDPQNPSFVGAQTANCFALRVSLLDGMAYVTTGLKNLSVIDVTDPGQPALARSFDTPGYASGLEVRAGEPVLAFVAAQSAGLRIINTTGFTPETTACDTAGHCTTVQASQSLAELVSTALVQEPQMKFDFPLAPAALSVEIQNLPPVLDHSDPITITGVATSTLASLQAITVTVDGAPLAVSGWTGGLQESAWQASWTPAGDGAHLVQASVSDSAGGQASQALTVTVDTQAPTIDVSPLLYNAADYYEPHKIHLRGGYADLGGVTAIEVRALDGSWQAANFANGEWDLGWQLDPGTLPDNQDFSILARATDIAGHVTETGATVNLDVLPPEPANLTLTANGTPAGAGERVPATGARLVLDWDGSQDGSGLDDYQVRWTTQVTTSASQQLTQTIPLAGPLESSYQAADGQKVSVELGSQDRRGNQRWQAFGSLFVDSRLTPDYIVLPDTPGAEVYRGWMESGCTLLGVDRRAGRIDGSTPGQSLYASWDAQALRLAWTGANWTTAGDLFIYLDSEPGGSQQAYDPFGAAYQVSLPDGMLADYVVWVQDGSTAWLLHWQGSWVVSAGPLALDSYQWSPADGRWEALSDLYLPFDQIGLQAGDGLSLLAVASEEDALDLWASLPNANPVNSRKALGRLWTREDESDFQLSQFYHWDALASGICPNGSNQPGSGAYLDTDLQADLSANPAGAGYSLLGDGLVWLQDLLLGSPPADVSTRLANLAADQPPLQDGQTVTYTLSYRNRGSETDYGVFVHLEALYALSLPGGTTIDIGDIPAGASGQITFRGQVDSSLSGEPWAGLAAEIYDAAHPQAGAPLEWLWAHHRVDSRGPEFFGIRQPDYLLGPGLNNLSGYAYDPAGVQNLDLLFSTPTGSQSLHCPDDTPTDGSWSCGWQVSGENNTVFSSQLKAGDGYGQSSGWQTGPTFLLDTQPPTLTLDVNATQLTSGLLTQAGKFTLYGTVQDNGGLGRVDICAAGGCNPADLLLDPGQAILSQEDIPPAPIAINSGTTCNGGEIQASFEVTRTFNVADVQLGFAAQHARRADLLVSLTSPTGKSVQILNADGLSGTEDRGADFWFNDAAGLDFRAVSGDQDPTLPFYRHEVRPAQPLHQFLGEPAAGTWSLRICDQDPATADGAYLRSRLVLRPQDGQSKSGIWSGQVQFSDTQEMDYVRQTIEVYGQDRVGNRSSTPLGLELIFDNVAPVIQVRSVATAGLLGEHLDALAGSVTDGGPSTDLSVHVYPPAGDPYRAKVRRDGNDWRFGLDLALVGTYTLWVEASDLAGNTSNAGPFTLSVQPPTTIYLPGVMKNFTTGPDLVVQDLLVTETDIELTLVNAGNEPVTDEFWVDVYINPAAPPTAVNQPWDQLGEQGLVWGVTDLSALTPGGTLTLNLQHPSFMPDYSHFSGSFSPGMAIYAQVDSYGDPTYGAVREIDEIEGTAYNNINGPVFHLPVQPDPNTLSAAGAPQPGKPDGLLPERPLEEK